MADHQPPPHGHDASEQCHLCPVCLLLGSVGDQRPEVREHLRAAGRELALALRAAFEGAGAEGPSEQESAPLRRVHLDEG